MKHNYKQQFFFLLFLSTSLLTNFTVSTDLSTEAALTAPEFEPYTYPGEQDYLRLEFRNENSGASTEIYHSFDENSGYQLVTTVGPGVREYYHYNLKPRTTHYYKLRARVGSEVSPFSEVYWATTYSKNYPPVFTARAIDANTIELSLTDKSYNDIAYYIRTTESATSIRYTDDFYQEVNFATDSGATQKVLHHPVEPGKTYYYSIEMATIHDQFYEAYIARTSMSTPVPACADAGSVEREVWTGISGGKVSSIPLYVAPNQITTLTSLQAPVNAGDNYGARIRGFLCAPQTGNYTFWIASDDQSELWLSTDTNFENKKLIGSVTGYTSIGQWEKYPTQKSVLIPLTAGKTYYFEILHKESASGDHLAVGWQLPDGTLERPVGGDRIIKYDRSNYEPNVSITSPANSETFDAPATVNVVVNGYDPESSITKVDLYLNDALVISDASAPYGTELKDLAGGDYTLSAHIFNNEGQDAWDYTYFRVITPACAGTGGIQREIWQNITGTSISSVPFDTPPTNYEQLTAFETGQYKFNNYGSRIRGYLCVPETGNYTFWIASDDNSELWLSTDEFVGNRRLIASVRGATAFRQYDKYPSQKSVSIALRAGRKYYIEALHKEGTGNDFISVGWQLPSGAVQQPIPGDRLIKIGSILENEQPVVHFMSPVDNATFTQGATIPLKVYATDPDGSVYSVSFEANGTPLTEIRNVPYEYQWTNVPAGSYSIIARVRDDKGAMSTDQLNITVNTAVQCAGAGKIYREIWTGIPGTSLSSVPFDTSPDAVRELTSFSTPNYTANEYGSRIRGYLCVPVDGNYTFYISSDDNSELYLSTDEDPGNKVKIAYLNGAVKPGVYNQYATQVSSPVALQGGRRYFIEALHKEGSGADFVAVAWRFQDGTFEGPIPGTRLSPYEDPAMNAAAFTAETTVLSDEQGSLEVFPNPVAAGGELTIAISDLADGEATVQLMSATGILVRSQQVSSQAGTVVINIGESLPAGMYLIRIARGRKQWSQKITVK